MSIHFCIKYLTTMKVQPFKYNSIYKYNNISRREEYTKSENRRTLPADTFTISFSAKEKKKMIKDLRLIPHITCASCGDETIPNGEIDRFFENKIYFPAKEALGILEKGGYIGVKGKKYYSVDDSKHKAYVLCKLLADLYEDKSLPLILSKKENTEVIKNLDDETKAEILKIEKMTQGLYRNSEYMVKELKIFEPRMHNTEKTVFHILEKASTKNPEKSFTEILSNPKLQNYLLKKLESKQERVFQSIAKISQTMNSKDRTFILNAIEQAKFIFDLQDSEVYSKRTTVVQLFQRLSEVMPKSEELEKIQMKIHELPSSLNDPASFVIKYANCNPNQIADLLIRGSASTIEHVIPKNGEEEKGENKPSNYIVLCKNCNCERSRMPYPEFEKIHPDMPQNTQKYIDIVIDNINNGTLVGYDAYPSAISKTLEKARNVKKSIDIRKLNLFEAAKKRGDNIYQLEKILKNIVGNND